MAVLCMISAGAAISTTAVSAAQLSPVTISSSIENKQASKDYIFKANGKTSYGYDWTYNIDNLCVKVNCTYNFAKNEYTFTVKGQSAGTVNAKLMYKTSDNNWVTKTVKLSVDKNLNVSVIG